MAGTKAGGEAAAKTNMRKYGAAFYAEIGRKGGMKRSPTKGFGGNRERARLAGAKGGRKSVRPPRNYDTSREA